MEDNYERTLQDEARELDQLVSRKNTLLAKKGEFTKKIRDLGPLSSDAFDTYISSLHYFSFLNYYSFLKFPTLPIPTDIIVLSYIHVFPPFMCSFAHDKLQKAKFVMRYELRCNMS